MRSVTPAFFVWDLFFDPRKREWTMARFLFIVAAVFMVSTPAQAQYGYGYWLWGNNDWGDYPRPGCMRITEIVRVPVPVEALRLPAKGPAGVLPVQPGVRPQPGDPKAKPKEKAAPANPDEQLRNDINDGMNDLAMALRSLNRSYAIAPVVGRCG